MPTIARTMRVFYVLLFGQNISAVGTQFTAFVLGVWVYRETGSVTLYALISFVATMPGLLFLPLIGTLVDYWDRRLILILSDSAAGLVTVATILLVISDRLEVWHIYLIVGLYAFFSTFQPPALSASITLLVPKDQYMRANGMMQAGQAAAQIIAPLLAGVLLGVIGIEGVVAIDLTTFLVSIVTLLAIRFPRIPSTIDGEQSKSSLREATLYGWRYISARPGLLGLLLFQTFVNFSMTMVIVLLTPLVLGFTSTAVLGTILSVSGIGLLLGSVFVSVRKGPVRRVQWIFGAVLMQALLLFLGGLQPNVPLVMGAAFLFMFFSPFSNSASQAIWQSKVAPAVQGRVFATRQMIGSATSPLAFLLAGPLADRVFEPLLAADGLLAGSVGRVIGVGAGRGVGLLFTMLGLLTLLAVLLGYLHPQVRRVEAELPDAIEETENRTVLSEVPSTHPS